MNKMYDKKIHEEIMRLREDSNKDMENFYHKVQRDTDELIQKKEQEFISNANEKTELALRSEIEMEYSRKEKLLNLNNKKILIKEKANLKSSLETEYNDLINKFKKEAQKEKSEIAQLKSIEHVRLKKLKDAKKETNSKMESQKLQYEKIISDLRKDLHEAIIAKDDLQESVTKRNLENRNANVVKNNHNQFNNENSEFFECNESYRTNNNTEVSAREKAQQFVQNLGNFNTNTTQNYNTSNNSRFHNSTPKNEEKINLESIMEAFVSSSKKEKSEEITKQILFTDLNKFKMPDEDNFNFEKVRNVTIKNTIPQNFDSDRKINNLENSATKDSKNPNQHTHIPVNFKEQTLAQKQAEDIVNNLLKQKNHKDFFKGNSESHATNIFNTISEAQLPVIKEEDALRSSNQPLEYTFADVQNRIESCYDYKKSDDMESQPNTIRTERSKKFKEEYESLLLKHNLNANNYSSSKSSARIQSSSTKNFKPVNRNLGVNEIQEKNQNQNENNSESKISYMFTKPIGFLESIYDYDLKDIDEFTQNKHRHFRELRVKYRGCMEQDQELVQKFSTVLDNLSSQFYFETFEKQNRVNETLKQ